MAGFWGNIVITTSDDIPGLPGMKPALSAGFSILGLSPPSVVTPNPGNFVQWCRIRGKPSKKTKCYSPTGL
jgi:hypothetical protein